MITSAFWDVRTSFTSLSWYTSLKASTTLTRQHHAIPALCTLVHARVNLLTNTTLLVHNGASLGGRSSNGWSISQEKQPARLLWGQQGMSLRDSTSSTGVQKPTSVEEATTMIWIPPVDLRCWFELWFIIVFLSTWTMINAISQSFNFISPFTPISSHILPHPCSELLRLGSRLAVVYALKGRVSDLLSWLGIKCSTWVMVNAGTSCRPICSSVGDLAKASVQEGNRMLERTKILQINCLHP